METARMTPGGRQTISHVQDAGPTPAPKWALFDQLTEARSAFGLGHSALAVLRALLSFHRRDTLCGDGDLIVFPSNAALSARAHGMPESTLRRHLAALVRAGLIARHDSPNGKRFARRAPEGGLIRAFGFDLRPLLLRAHAIAMAAEQARADAAERKLIREDCVLALRDVSARVPSDATDTLERLARARGLLRRKVAIKDLIALRAELAHLRDGLQPTDTPKSSVDDSQIERHQQSPKPESEIPSQADAGRVVAACPTMTRFTEQPIRSWEDMIALASMLRPMVGIDQTAWDRACHSMGQTKAATSLACIIENARAIRRPSAYLTKLTQSAEAGTLNLDATLTRLLERQRVSPC